MAAQRKTGSGKNGPSATLTTQGGNGAKPVGKRVGGVNLSEGSGAPIQQDPGVSVSDPEVNDTRTQILDAAEALLRRHGLDKLTVTDVAQALKMSHGNVYRHFSSKAALRATVIERWLERVAEQTASIAAQSGPADRRLKEWLTGLALVKQKKVIDDAEMLTAATRIVRETPEVERQHAVKLHAQVVRILQDGLRDGTLPGVHDPQAVATAVLDATFRYHHPDQVAIGGSSEMQLAALDAVIALILGALGAHNDRNLSS